ncbi:MAG: hypothetical protein ACPGGB_11620, partial [Flavobacteriales bacterium]
VTMADQTETRTIKIKITLVLGPAGAALAGMVDPEADQVWGLTGTGSHTRSGMTRSRTVIEELILDRTCGEVIAGVVEIERPVLENGVMDFGEGACDGSATLTIGGEVYTIDL